jgi:hypothetical protein
MSAGFRLIDSTMLSTCTLPRGGVQSEAGNRSAAAKAHVDIGMGAYEDSKLVCTSQAVAAVHGIVVMSTGNQLEGTVGALGSMQPGMCAAVHAHCDDATVVTPDLLLLEGVAGWL